MLLFIYSLGSGGAERACVNMGNHWADKGHDVTIVTFRNPETDFYKLGPTIRRESIGTVNNSSSGLWRKLARNLEWVKALRNCLQVQRPDVVISFMTTANVLAALAAIGMKIPVIMTEHTNPRAFVLDRQWRMLRRLTYPFAGVLISVSKGTNDCFSWLRPSRHRVIMNALAPEFENLPLSERSVRKKQIVSMGRLSFEKGFDLLLEAFAQITERNPDWTLLILGEGDERQELEQQVKTLRIGEKVKMPGAVNNVIPFLRESSVFVLSSRFEGFGNVIIEAMACGTPVIATDCHYGPSEIISHGENGLLVSANDVDALAVAIEKLIQNQAERDRLAAKARTSLGRFQIDNVMNEWETLIHAEIDRKGNTLAALQEMPTD